MNISYRRIFPVLIAALLCIGCSNRVDVTGKVTYSDGTPLQVGQVVFSNGQLAYRGPIDQTGFYTLGGDYAGDGIAPGKYNLYFIDTEISEFSADGAMKTTQHVAPKYLTAETSGLQCEVKGKMVFDITVERP